MPLINLPNELLRLVLGHLLDLDICSFHVARRTCKAFNESATDILATDVANHTPTLHAFAMSNFAALIDTSTVPSFRDQIVKDCHIPFRALPWAADAKRRAKFLYPRASWRRLPLCSASGTIVSELQVVQMEISDYGDLQDFQGYRVMFPLWQLDDGGDSHCYTDEELCNPRTGVTLEWLYDVILSHRNFHPHPLGRGWRVALESRVSNPVQLSEAVRRFRLREIVVTKEDVDAMIVKADCCVVLFEFGGGYRKHEDDEIEETWIPDAAMNDGPITIPF